MRWYGAQVETYFPGVFFTGIRTANPLLDDKWFETFVVIPACLLVFVYAMALAYAASYFSDADRQKVSDDHVYTPYDSALIAKLETLHPFRGQLVFLATYLFLGCASFLITPLLWSSLSIHVFYLLAITLVCIQNGAKYYLTVCPRENWGSGHRAAILEMEDLLFPSRMQPPRAILPNAALENRAQTAIFLSLPLNNVIRKQDYEWRMAAISKGAVVVPRRAPAGSDVYGHERVPMPPKSSRAHKSQRNPISSTSSETRESSAMAARS